MDKQNDCKISRRKFIERSVLETGAILAGSQLGSVITANTLLKKSNHKLNDSILSEGVFPFYKYAREYNFGEYIPKDQGGKFIQMELLGTEEDENITSIINKDFIDKHLGYPNDWSVFEKTELEKSVWFNRFYYLPSFARMYYLSKNKDCLVFLMDLLKNWINENPVAGPSKSRYNWFDMQVAWRSINISWCYFLAKEGLSDSDKEVIYNLQGEHAKILMKDFGKKELNEFNHQSHGALAILYLAILFPSLPESPELLKTGIRIINHHVKKAFYEDGGNVEQMFGYYPFMTSVFRDAYLLLKSNHVGEPEHIFPLLKKMYHFLGVIAQPDKTVPPINDSFEETTEYVLLTLRDIIGKENLPEISNSYCLKDSQVAVMRSEPNVKKLWYILLNPAKLIGSHAHAGRLAVNLWYNNKPILVDSGCCNYDNSLLVDWYRTSEAHNTVIIDGKSDFATSQKNVQWVAKRITENRIEQFLDMQEYKFCRMVSPESDETNSMVRWTRDVVLLMDKYVIIHDCFESSDPHKYDTLFRYAGVKINQLNSTNRLLIDSGDKLVLIPISERNSQCLQIKDGYFGSHGKNVVTPTSVYSISNNKTLHSTYLIKAIENDSDAKKILVKQQVYDTNCSVRITDELGQEICLTFNNDMLANKEVFVYKINKKS